MTFSKSIQSELLKLKYPPIIWMVCFIIAIALAIVFSAHLIDINRAVTLGASPWIRLNGAVEATFSIFIGVPFIILLVSSAVHVEHQNNGFKQLYTLPKNRELFLLYKLFAILLILVLTILMLIVGQIVSGYVLNIIFPETEFSYYSIPIFSMIKSYCYTSISFLGVIGVQFFLSIRFKGFLLPTSIGIIAYIIGLILSSINNWMSTYFPYSFSAVARNREMVDTSALNIDQSAYLNIVEIRSIALLIVFILLCLLTERNKNI